MAAPRKAATKRQPAKKAAAPKQSPRDRLLGRPRPSLQHQLLVNPDGIEAARAQLSKVQAETRQTFVKEQEGSAAYKAAAKRRESAEAAVEACYETIVLRALPPQRVEQLETEHPPTAEQMERCRTQREQAKQRGEDLPDWPSWNDDTYWPALLAECAETDMTVEDWAAFLAQNVSDGEARSLKMAALQVNRQERVADPLVLPKGWMPTIS